ncbi:MAG: SRPBCC family protein [Pseudomonadota bacterium]
MKLKITDDAAAPVDAVFAAITDFSSIEEALRDNGISITRVGGWLNPEVGSAWTGRGAVRGKTRRIEAEVSAMEPGRMIEIEARIGGLRAVQETRFVPIGEQLTRLNVALDLRPDTLAARLLVQNLKLVRGRLLARMSRRLATEIERIERGTGAGSA